MWDALIVLAMGIIGGGACVWLLSGAVFVRFHQRCTKLEVAVDDLQQRALSVRGKEMSEKRWSKKDVEDLEMAQILKAAPSRSRKYDNDPLGEV